MNPSAPSQRRVSQPCQPPGPHYRMEKIIGKGNFAVVKLATHTLTQTQVAVKIIDKQQLDEENLRKVYREVDIMKKLDHTNIIRLYQVVDGGRHLYIVTEYASGGEVFEYLIKHKRMPEPDARKKFRQIVEAVDYCHKRGIVHRDLKAENLLLDSEDCVKLADFGFSNYYMKDELLKTFCGSPPYAAPELFEGTSYSGPQADIWSLGVVLYVLVCGAVPFDGHNLHSLKARVLDGRFRIPFYMSQECEQLIRRMLVTNPAKRQSLSKVLTHKWMVAEGKGGAGGGEGEPKKELECRLQVYDETTGAVHWCEPVLSVIQQMGLDVNEVKRAVEERAYNDPAAVYYMLLEQWSKGRLIARRPSLPTMLQTPRIVIDPSTNTQHTLLGGSALMEGGVFGPGEELRRSPIEITGPDPTVGAFLAGRRQTIVGIPPTPEQLQHLSHLAEQAQQQGGGGTEGGREVDGSASGLGATPNMIVQNESMHPQPLHHRPPQSIYSALGIPTPAQSGGVGRNSRIARRRVSDGAWKLAEYQQMMQVRHTNANQLAMIVGSGQMSGSITASGGLDGSGSMRQIKEDYHKLHAMQKPYGRLPQSRIAYKPVMNLTQVDPQSLHSIMCGVGGVQGISGGVPHASGNLSDLATPMSLQQQLAQSQKSPPHPAGPPPDLQSQLRPFQGLAPHDLQRQLQQLNISQRSGDTSPERQESPTQGHLSGRVSPNSGNSSRKSSFGGPSPAQQPLMGQFMGAHQLIVGASGSGTRIGVAQPTPMASILSQQQSKLPNQFSPVTKDAHRKLHSTRSNPVASSDVMRPSNLIQQTPYIHHPSILYGTPPGIASGPFMSPVPVVPAVVAPPLQTQLHHGCGMVVSHATPNGNPVNCQNNMESQAPPSPEAYLSAAGRQLEAVLTAIGLTHHRVSPSEFLVQGNSTVLKIVLSQTSNGHINLEPLHTQGDVHVFQTIIREISSKLVQPSAV